MCRKQGLICPTACAGPCCSWQVKDGGWVRQRNLEDSKTISAATVFPVWGSQGSVGEPEIQCNQVFSYDYHNVVHRHTLKGMASRKLLADLFKPTELLEILSLTRPEKPLNCATFCSHLPYKTEYCCSRELRQSAHDAFSRYSGLKSVHSAGQLALRIAV